MKAWIVAAIMTGLLLFAGIALVKAVSVSEDLKTANIDPASCTSCGNSCTTAGRNCGLATCGAVNDPVTSLNGENTREIVRGKCTCGQK